MSPTDRINHVVARADNGSVIMKRIEGVPLKWENNPKEIYDLPDKAYKHLLSQITRANKLSMIFDSSPSNIIYDSKNRILTAVDFYQLKPEEVGNKTYEINRPFKQVFACLHSKTQGLKHRYFDYKLIGKLVNIFFKECIKKDKPDFKLSLADFNAMMSRFRVTQFPYLPTQFSILQDSINNIVYEGRLKKMGKNVGGNYEENIEYVKNLLSNIFD